MTQMLKVNSSDRCGGGTFLAAEGGCWVSCNRASCIEKGKEAPVVKYRNERKN